ncbi:maleylpyruvate isomerase N-terminal domain-containing protein [Glycomyces sp. NRRL B-16210]|uniref:maleylpyruvate isomerase N-terminal domain-containing protein n=1 Tax=Glycomyces sp. NRRL B-16210 TaxID=1463821 RepID=UPI0004C245DB|nr:maleylpyruvate isomerase N-terminal domain-containing protein [Glycomyces sp. NRRL B-16210]
MTDVRSQYLAAAQTGLDLLARPEVADQWGGPSALEDFSVGGLAAHLANQILSAVQAIDTDYTGRPRRSLYEHFFGAPWLAAGPEAAANVAIRGGGERLAETGPAGVHAAAAAALATLRERLPGVAADAPGGNASWAYATTFDEFLVTRIMELVVHADDLACSVAVDTPEFDQDAFDTAAAVLTRLAAHRHGQANVVRALARAERAPASISGL